MSKGTNPGGRERQDRSVGRAGGGAGESDLCGTETGHDPRRSGAALARRDVAKLLSSFTPKRRRRGLPPAGTVHSLDGVVVFEVQENSDVTFRLYDWDDVDPKTNKPATLAS